MRTWFAVGFAVLAVCAAPALAQQTGSISGTVTVDGR